MIETTSDSVFALLNFIYFLLASIDFTSVLRIVFLVFFFVYIYRIIIDFSMFSKSTAFVMALGLAVILELLFGLFGSLANIFSGLFLFIGGNLGGIVAILVGLVALLLIYFILSRISWIFRKRTMKARESKRHIKREAGKAFLEKVGEHATGKKAGEIAAIADKLKSIKGVSPPVKKKK